MIKTYTIHPHPHPHPIWGDVWSIAVDGRKKPVLQPTAADAQARILRMARSTAAAWRRNGYVDVDVAVSDDGMTVTVTATPPAGQMITRTLQLPDQMWQAVMERAAADNIPAVEVVRRAIREYVNK